MEYFRSALVKYINTGVVCKKKVAGDNSLNTGIENYGGKPADGGGEEQREGAGERWRVMGSD